jgi:hypothetical protein
VIDKAVETQVQGVRLNHGLFVQKAPLAML